MTADLSELHKCHARLAESLDAAGHRFDGRREISINFLVTRGWTMINPGTFRSPYDPSRICNIAKALKIERRKDSKAHFAAVEAVLRLHTNERYSP